MKSKIAIIDGLRTPYCRSFGALRDYEPDDLGAAVVKELVARNRCPQHEIQEIIFGNVLAPHYLANISRIIALKSGLPTSISAYSVNRNCASGMQAVMSAAEQIALGKAEVVIAGGCESMSNTALLFRKEMRDYLLALSKAKNWWARLKQLLAFRLKMLVPIMPELNDPLCGLSMGQTAELLAREFHVTRQEQDEYAFHSQSRASEAEKKGFFAEEVVALPLPPKFLHFQNRDDGIRHDQTLKQLAELKPVFDRINGSITAGTSSQLTDGAAALLLVSEEKAQKLGIKPLGYILDWASAGLEPSRMGLGPVYAVAKLFEQNSYQLEDFDLIEINEAFAAQVLACQKAFGSAEFARQHLHRENALGVLSHDKLNVNGGAIALGHPLGASGARLIITLLKELKRRKKKRGLAALCIGGGQGSAMALEVAE